MFQFFCVSLRSQDDSFDFQATDASDAFKKCERQLGIPQDAWTTKEHTDGDAMDGLVATHTYKGKRVKIWTLYQHEIR